MVEFLPSYFSGLISTNFFGRQISTAIKETPKQNALKAKFTTMLETLNLDSVSAKKIKRLSHKYFSRQVPNFHQKRGIFQPLF